MNLLTGGRIELVILCPKKKRVPGNNNNLEGQLALQTFQMVKEEGTVIVKKALVPVRIFTCSLSEGEKASFLQSDIQQSCREPHEIGSDMSVWAGSVTREPLYSHF